MGLVHMQVYLNLGSNLLVSPKQNRPYTSVGLTKLGFRSVCSIILTMHTVVVHPSIDGPTENEKENEDYFPIHG